MSNIDVTLIAYNEIGQGGRTPLNNRNSVAHQTKEAKMTITQVTKYQTEDGQLFDSHAAAVDHETKTLMISELGTFLYVNTSLGTRTPEEVARAMLQRYNVTRKDQK